MSRARPRVIAALTRVVAGTARYTHVIRTLYAALSRRYRCAIAVIADASSINIGHHRGVIVVLSRVNAVLSRAIMRYRGVIATSSSLSLHSRNVIVVVVLSVRLFLVRCMAEPSYYLTGSFIASACMCGVAQLFSLAPV